MDFHEGLIQDLKRSLWNELMEVGRLKINGCEEQAGTH